MKEYIVRYETEQIENSEFFYGGKVECELVRCKDCKFFERRSIYHHGLCDVHCNGAGEPEVTSETYYCAWAERKEE